MATTRTELSWAKVCTAVPRLWTVELSTTTRARPAAVIAPTAPLRLVLEMLTSALPLAMMATASEVRLALLIETLQLPEASGVLGVVALGIGTPGIVNEGIVLTQLSMPRERERSQKDIQNSLMAPLKRIAGIKAYAISPSPMRGFSSSPIVIVIQGDDIGELARISDEVEREAEATGIFKAIRSDLFLNKPQLEVSIDRERANDLGMSVRDIATTMQILLGGVDISTFKKDGETYNVMAQLEARYRDNPTSLEYLFVRGHSGLIPLSAVVQTKMTTDRACRIPIQQANRRLPQLFRYEPTLSIRPPGFELPQHLFKLRLLCAHRSPPHEISALSLRTRHPHRHALLPQGHGALHVCFDRGLVV